MFQSQGEHNPNSNNFNNNSNRDADENSKQFKEMMRSQEYIDNFPQDPMAMIWSNDSSKVAKQKLMGTEEPFGKKRKLNFGTAYEDE